MAGRTLRSRDYLTAKRDPRHDFASIEVLGGEANKPFDIEDLWEPSIFPLHSPQPLENPGWDDGLPNLAHGVFRSPLGDFAKNESTLFSLNVFGTDQLDLSDVSGNTASASSVHASDHGDAEDVSERGDDIWDLDSLSKPQNQNCVLRSWDTFPDHPSLQPPRVFLSEAGRHGFDAALVFQATQSGLEDSGRVSQTEPFMWSLFRLGLGWNSVFFRFNEQTRRFEKDIKDARISGISLSTLDSLIQEILECGTHVRSIRRFIAAVPKGTNPSSSLSGLSRASFVLLYSMEDQLCERFRTGLSLLELQELFRRSGCLMKCLLDVTNSVTNATSDGEIISSVFRKCDHYSQEFVWLADILHELMTLVAKPWLSLIATWIGVRSPSDELSIGANESDIDEFIAGPGDIPDFVPPEQVEAILESGRTLRLLRASHHGHPLAKKADTARTVNPPSFECAVTWDDIDRIQHKAHAYEAQLKVEILKNSESQEACAIHNNEDMTGSDQQRNDPVPTDTIYELSDLDSAVDTTRSLGTQRSISSHKLYRLLADSPCFKPHESLEVEAPFGPPLAISVYLSFSPVIFAQTRLIDFSFLQLLFKNHNIRDHLQLQWRFQLLGDSTFLSQISQTLFDPSMESGERKAGVTRGGLSTGLRLGSRDTWPPASSELRLVLMGMLTECYQEDRHTGGGQDKSADVELPGGLSFAIRELTDGEITKCKNPNAIEALDFLRLQYSPPSLLDEIITPKSLDRYDRLFKHLLRLTRMLSIARSLVHEITNRNASDHNYKNIERKFRFEAQHFIQSLSDYAFNVCVADTWRKFEKFLQKIEKCIERDDFSGTLELAGSPARLRERHEDVLGKILFSLFLTKKHVQASRQLDHIFGIVLTYSSFSKFGKMQEVNKCNSRYERSIYQLYADFRKHVGGFVRFLRSLDGSKSTMSRSKHPDLESGGVGQAAGVGVNSVFEHLLIRLDMKEYY